MLEMGDGLLHDSVTEIGMIKTAIFGKEKDKDGNLIYRYALMRMWDPEKRLCTFCMLNPSTADAHKDDSTIRKCQHFARLWGYGGIVVVNIFAFRSTYPRLLKKAKDPVGPRNDDMIMKHCRSGEVVCAWGAHGTYLKRGGQVWNLMSLAGLKPKCFYKTKDGEPGHPLYVAYSTPLIPMSPEVK